MNYVLPIQDALISALSWEIEQGRMKDARYDASLVFKDGRLKEIKYIPSKKESDGN